MSNEAIKASLLRQRAGHWRKHRVVEGDLVAQDFEAAASYLEAADKENAELRTIGTNLCATIDAQLKRIDHLVTENAELLEYKAMYEGLCK